MSNDPIDPKKITNKDGDESAIKPDPETLNTTDPQDNMEGPVSSVVQTVKDEVEDTSETKQEADERKDENM